MWTFISITRLMIRKISGKVLRSMLLNLINRCQKEQKGCMSSNFPGQPTEKDIIMNEKYFCDKHRDHRYSIYHGACRQPALCGYVRPAGFGFTCFSFR